MTHRERNGLPIQLWKIEAYPSMEKFEDFLLKYGEMRFSFEIEVFFTNM